MKGKLFVVSAPSGAGKSSLINKALKQIPDLVYSISATTRPKRGHEKEGVNYFFKSHSEFKEMIKKGELLEFEKVHGHYYGTPKYFVEKMLSEGKHVIMDIDVKGKLKLDKVYPEAIGVFITVSDMSELKKRLMERASDSSNSIELRLKNSQEEIRLSRLKGKYEYTVINDRLAEAVKNFIRIIKENI